MLDIIIFTIHNHLPFGSGRKRIFRLTPMQSHKEAVSHLPSLSFIQNIIMYYISRLGTPTPSKTDEFSEKFQTAFDPPPHFRKVMLQIFSEIHDRSIVYNGKNLQHKFLD